MGIDTTAKKVQINKLVRSQLPSFVAEDNPQFVDFLKQYYISQEYQGGSTNIIENIDRYTKLQTYVGAALTEYTGLSTDTESYSDTIFDIDTWNLGNSLPLDDNYKLSIVYKYFKIKPE